MSSFKLTNKSYYLQSYYRDYEMIKCNPSVNRIKLS